MGRVPGSGVSDDPSRAHPDGYGLDDPFAPGAYCRGCGLGAGECECERFDGRPSLVPSEVHPGSSSILPSLSDGLDPRAQLGLVVDGAELAPRLDPGEDQYHTPPALADRLLSLVTVAPREGIWSTSRGTGLSLHHEPVVLDLGAGGGALTDAALRAGAVHVVAVERDARWVAFLRARYRNDPRVRVIEADVDALGSMGEREACARLGLDRPADVVVSNPPFKGGGFVRFALAALVLVPRGAPCAFIGPIVALPTVGSLSLWNTAELSDVAICSRRPTFGSAQGMGAKEDFVAVRFSFEPGMGETHHGARVHFWPEAWS